MRSKRKQDHGFILMDVALGIFIIGITVLSVSLLFTQALKAERVAKEYTVATILAQKQLELLKTKPPAYWENVSLPSAIPWQDDNVLPPAAYQFITYAARCPLESHLVQVTVTVAWKNGPRSYTIELVTFYAGGS